MSFDLGQKKGPSKDFAHTDGCPILAADPTVSIPWSEIETGHWRAECVCGIDHVYEQPADRRARLDPLDPKTSRHAGECEFGDEREPAVLKHILKVKDGMGGGYWWVECNACDSAWQVPHFSKSVGARR